MATTFSLGKNPEKFYDSVRTLLATPGVGLTEMQRAELQEVLSRTPQQIASGDFVCPVGFGRTALHVLIAMAAVTGRNDNAVILMPDSSMTYSNISKLSTMPCVTSVSLDGGIVVLNNQFYVAPYQLMDAVLATVGVENVSMVIAGDAFGHAGKNRLTRLRDMSANVPVFGLNAPAQYSASLDNVWMTAYVVAQKYIKINVNRIRDAMADILRIQRTQKKYKDVKILEVKHGTISRLHLYDSPENITAFVEAANECGHKIIRRLEPLTKFNMEAKTSEWLSSFEVAEKYIQGSAHKVYTLMYGVFTAQKKHNKYMNVKMENLRSGNTPALRIYDSPENIAAFIDALRSMKKQFSLRSDLARLPQKTDNWISIMDVSKKYIEGTADKLRDAICAIMQSKSRFPNVKIQEMVNSHKSTGLYLYDSIENMNALVAAARILGYDISMRDNSIPIKTPDWATATQAKQSIVGNKDKVMDAMRAVFDAQAEVANPRFTNVELKIMRSHSNLALCLHMTEQNVRAFVAAAAELGFKFKLRDKTIVQSFERGADAVAAAAAVALTRFASGMGDEQKQH